MVQDFSFQFTALYLLTSVGPFDTGHPVYANMYMNVFKLNQFSIISRFTCVNVYVYMCMCICVCAFIIM